MKKYFLLSALAAVTAMTAVSCDNSNDSNNNVEDNDTYSVSYDLKNIDFSYDKNNGYFISKTFNNPISTGDVVLIYRQSGTSNGTPVWQQIPRTLYLTQGELDYDFDFTKNDIYIKAGGNFDISTTLTYIKGQTFRVVIVPSTMGNAKIDFSNYDAVASYLRIKEKDVKSL